MILGALAVSTAVATEREHSSTNHALLRECDRYGLDYDARAECLQRGSPRTANPSRGWDYAILAVRRGRLCGSGLQARVPTLEMNLTWAAILVCCWSSRPPSAPGGCGK